MTTENPVTVPQQVADKRPDPSPNRIAEAVESIFVRQPAGTFLWSGAFPEVMAPMFRRPMALGIRRPTGVSVLVQFSVEVRYLNGSEPDMEKPPIIVSEAQFLVDYMLKADAGFNDEDLDIFARVNGIFTAYPYWREFLHGALSRNLFSPVPLPQFVGGRVIADGFDPEFQRTATEMIGRTPWIDNRPQDVPKA